jgi:single-strand DNA-binding protein
MSGINKVILLGRLGQDPELKYTPNGVAVCTFSVATSKQWNDKNSGQKQEKTEWHRIVTWNKTADICAKYLAKGRQVYLEGELETRSWEDKNGGGTRYSTEVVVDKVEFIGSSNEGQSNRQEPPARSGRQQPQQNFARDINYPDNPVPANAPSLDDIPF